jgi:hypothetical protein
VLAAAALLAGRAAAADRAVRLELRAAEAFPFSEADLRAAVEARLPLAGEQAPGAALVSVTGDGAGGPVAVASQGRQQQVPVAGKTATEAARLVALAVLDVSRPLPPGPAPAAELAAPAPTPTTAASGGFALGLVPTLVRGLAGQAAAFEPTVDLGWRSQRRLGGGRLGAGLTLGMAQASARWFDRQFVLQTLPVRLGPRWRWRWLEAGAGGVARLYRTRGIDGGSGAIAGAFVSLRAVAPVGQTLQAVAALGCDGYSERLDFKADALSLLTSEHVMPWLGLGLEWGARR